MTASEQEIVTRRIPRVARWVASAMGILLLVLLGLANFGFFTTVLFSAATYSAWRLGTGLCGVHKAGLFALAFVWAALVLGVPFASENIASELGRTLWLWFAFLGVGVTVLLFTLLLIKDAALLAYSLFHRLVTGSEFDEKRRQFLGLGLNAGVAATTAVSTSWGVYSARRLPDIVEVDLPISGLPESLEGFRIVQLSDLHVGPTIHHSMVKRIAERIEELDADLIAITGDLVQTWVDVAKPHLEPILDLGAPYGVYFVTGNHEYNWDVLHLCELLSQRGIKVLHNEHEIVEVGDSRLLVAGCTDYASGHRIDGHKSSPGAAIKDAEDFDVSVLLAHQPDSIDEAVIADYDVQLCGHTHGGQFWPLTFLIGGFHDFSRGLHRIEDTWLYVSRGAGYAGPPMRIGAPPELTVLRLTSANN